MEGFEFEITLKFNEIREVTANFSPLNFFIPTLPFLNKGLEVGSLMTFLALSYPLVLSFKFGFA